MSKPTQFFLVYPEDALQRGKTLPALSRMIPGEILFQQINCGFFAAHKVLGFPPKPSAQDSTESLCKFYSKKSNAVFSSHAKFSARRGCPSFHREPVEILFQKINCCFFAWRKVFRQKKVPKIPWRACWNPNQPGPPRARSMARMHLLCTTEVNASLLPSRISYCETD